MPSHRGLRMAEAIREVVSEAILFHVADPRVRSVTVLRAELSGDLRNASVYVSIMGSPADQDKAMSGLRSATGYIQSRVAARLQTRFTPALSFKRDDSIKRSVEMSKLIDQALSADRGQSPESATPPPEEVEEPEDVEDDASD